MIILDTNVISALMGDPARNRPVIEWARSLGEQPVTTTISRAEVFSGIVVLPPGARRTGMAADAARAFAAIPHCLPFTDIDAGAYAEIIAERRQAGRPVGALDAMIAAIARTHEAGLATRNTADFDGLGLRLIDPWAPG